MIIISNSNEGASFGNLCVERIWLVKKSRRSQNSHTRALAIFYLAKPFMSGSTEGRKANAGESNEAWLKALAIFYLAKP